MIYNKVIFRAKVGSLPIINNTIFNPNPYPIYII